MHQMKGWRVAAKFEKKKLLLAINCVAALSIFFFGKSTCPSSAKYD